MLMRSSCATSAKNIGKIFYNAATRSTGASRVDARKSPYWRTPSLQVSSKPGGLLECGASVTEHDFLKSLGRRNRRIQMTEKREQIRYDWKIVLKIRPLYRLQKVDIKWFCMYEVVKGCSRATLTQLNHLYTFLNMIVHLGRRVLLYSLQHRQQSFPVKAIF